LQNRVAIIPINRPARYFVATLSIGGSFLSDLICGDWWAKLNQDWYYPND